MRRFFLIMAICTGVLWSGPVGADEGDKALYDRAAAAFDRGDYAEAFDSFRVLAEMGRVDSQFNLGIMYYYGQGISQDYARAAKWFRKAAEQGDTDAQLNLGVMYRKGQGVPQDYAEAVKWCRKAAEQGHAPAQNNLGFMHDNGYGVAEDYVQAHMWFTLSAARGNEQARKNLDIVAQEKTPAQIAEAQRLAGEWEAEK